MIEISFIFETGHVVEEWNDTEKKLIDALNKAEKSGWFHFSPERRINMGLVKLIEVRHGSPNQAS